MTDVVATPGTDGNSAFTSVPIEVTVSVGKAKPMIKDLVSLKQNSILELDKKVDDPVELMIGDRVIARGTLEEAGDGADGKLCVRLTEIIDLKSGFE